MSTRQPNIVPFVYKWEDQDKHCNRDENRNQVSYSPDIFTFTYNAWQYKTHVNITDVASSGELSRQPVRIYILTRSLFFTGVW